MNNSKSKNRVAAVIPFYNESRTINEVITNSLKYVDCVIAVDDGSIDNPIITSDQNEKIILMKLGENHGKGFALKAGMEKGLEEGFDIIVTLDADLQHNPDEIPLLLTEAKKYPIVIGNRLKNLNGMPLSRKLSNILTSKLLSFKTGQIILDSQCGFRAYHSEVIKNVNTLKKAYEAESELLIKAARKGYKIGFADISTIYGVEKSKMKSFRTTIGFIRVLFN